MNNGDQAAEFLYLLGVLMLVTSALVVRRIPMGKGLRMAAAWILIFLALFALFALRDDFLGLGRRLMGEFRGDAAAVTDGSEVRIRQATDGHFWVDAELNGQTVRFLVDSGATVTSLSTRAAERAGVVFGGGFPVAVETANGIAYVNRGRAERLRLGTIERRDLAVHVSDGFGDTNVLGMNFLSSLSGWSVEGRWLILRP